MTSVHVPALGSVTCSWAPTSGTISLLPPVVVASRPLAAAETALPLGSTSSANRVLLALSVLTLTFRALVPDGTAIW